MYLLDTEEAIRLVRKNFDEQDENESNVMDFDDKDSNEFEELLKKTLPEAINEVHSNAPVQMLDGETLSEKEYSNISNEIKDGVLSFAIHKEILRLIAFKAEDSPYVVSELVPEYSTLGRMQLNPYSRGTSDNPRLVVLQGKTSDSLTSFRYYSLTRRYPVPAQAIEKFEYIPRYRYDRNTPNQSFRVAENVVGNIIDTLTGMMMAVYGMTNSATYFMTKGSFGQTNPSATPSE